MIHPITPNSSYPKTRPFKPITRLHWNTHVSRKGLSPAVYPRPKSTLTVASVMAGGPVQIPHYISRGAHGEGGCIPIVHRDVFL